jgi:hypothetical protein
MERSCADCPEKIEPAVSRREKAMRRGNGPVLARDAFQA